VAQDEETVASAVEAFEESADSFDGEGGAQPAAKVAADVGRTERWVRKWAARYDTGEETWNSRHERPARSLAGPRPALLRSSRTVVAETRNAEPAQLADDALVAPARILARESQDQLSDLAADRWPTNLTRICPAPRDQPAVPAKQCRWRDDKGPPARSRQQPAGGSEEDSIGGPQRRPGDLAAQHRQLVAEHHDLQLFELLRTKTQRSELQNASKHEVAERPEQDRLLRDGGTGRAPDSREHCRTELTHPTGSM
jgi:hypothetical protein